MEDKIFATWCISNNIGDALNVWLIKKLTGFNPIYVEKNEYCTKHILIGSILNWADRYSIVWGAGIANMEDSINPLADIRAVRGPISMERARARGATCPEVCGDPALLLPIYFTPKIKKTHKIGIIPHYVDQFVVNNSWLSNNDDVKIINVFNDVESFVMDILSCEKILSSSLHGLIISDAYNVPSRWFQASNKIGGDDTKYYDYFLSVKYEIYKPMKFYDIINMKINTIFDEIGNNFIRIDLKKLMDACPLLKGRKLNVFTK